MACILGKTVDGHELGLHIRRESRVFSRSEIDAFGALVHFNMYPVGAGRNLCTHFTNLVQSGFEYIIARFVNVTSPPVAATAQRKVPVSILSGMTSCFAPCKRSTP